MAKSRRPDGMQGPGREGASEGCGMVPQSAYRLRSGVTKVEGV